MQEASILLEEVISHYAPHPFGQELLCENGSLGKIVSYILSSEWHLAIFLLHNNLARDIIAKSRLAWRGVQFSKLTRPIISNLDDFSKISRCSELIERLQISMLWVVSVLRIHCHFKSKAVLKSAISNIDVQWPVEDDSVHIISTVSQCMYRTELSATPTISPWVTVSVSDHYC